MSNSISSFKDLKVWQRSVLLAKRVYELTERFPTREVYGLSDQMRRASISVSSNIAEGFGRSHRKEKIQFYAIAHGSLSELESQLEVSRVLLFLDDKDYNELTKEIIEISKMVSGLSKSLSPRSSQLAARAGFTLVELLVAITLFSIVISIAVGGFVRALRTQRQIISLIAANSNASLAIEQMARELRTGKNLVCDNGARFCDALTFQNADNDTVVYLVEDGVLERKVNSGEPQPFTAANVRIPYAHFSVPDTNPDRVTISLGVGVYNPELEENITNIQTTVSSRAL